MDKPTPRRKGGGRPLVNRHALTDTTHESAGLGVLGAIVHPVEDAERLVGSVFREDRLVGEFEVVTEEESRSLQAELDLSRFGLGPSRPGSRSSAPTKPSGCCGEEPGKEGAPDVPRLRLSPRGYLVFHVSWGAPGYRVTLAAPGEEEPSPVFDSRSLGRGDLFALTLIRPGRYDVEDVVSEARGTIRVTYPEPGEARRAAQGPVRVAVRKGDLSPAEIRVSPAQGVVFVPEAEASIRVALAEPDDGPEGGQKGRPGGGSRRRGRASPRQSR